MGSTFSSTSWWVLALPTKLWWRQGISEVDSFALSRSQVSRGQLSENKEKMLCSMCVYICCGSWEEGRSNKKWKGIIHLNSVQYDYKSNRIETIPFVKKYFLLSETVLTLGWIVLSCLKSWENFRGTSEELNTNTEIKHWKNIWLDFG